MNGMTYKKPESIKKGMSPEDGESIGEGMSPGDGKSTRKSRSAEKEQPPTRQQQNVTDLEWGWVYRTTLEAIKKENPMEGQKSADLVARRFGVSRRTVHRKIRLTYLIPQLYELGQKQQYSQRILLDLSYLTPVQQTNVVQAVVIEGFSLNRQIVQILRTRSEQGPLTIDDVLRLFRQNLRKGQSEEKTAGPISIYPIPDSMFPRGLTLSQRQKYLFDTLRHARERKRSGRG